MAAQQPHHPPAGPPAPAMHIHQLPVRPKPQAYLSSYSPRLRAYNNSLLVPVLPSAPTTTTARTTKRGTTIINYAEDGYDEFDDDDDDGGGRRRPTGLRSLRREDTNTGRPDPSDKVGKDTERPVELQGIYREWMPTRKNARSEQQSAGQAALPLTLIPIRLDVDIPAFTPAPAIPSALSQPLQSYDTPAFRPGEATVPYKLRDFFLWNLHESLMTTDSFAQTLVQDLDLPFTSAIVQEISKQIRTQLEEYAGVALHPLFHTAENTSAPVHGDMRRPSALPGLSGGDAAENGSQQRNGENGSGSPDATAEAALITDEYDELNPDDTYRCIINLSLNIGSTLYTDKFEWSLLHPAGTAEAFAKQTCADLGLHGEWIPAITHAIYEAVLRLKKEACEAGGLVAGWGGMQQELPNDAAQGAEAGWRYDPEFLGDEWEPKVEVLGKEEMEKREIDRERQLRRLRRETARFSSTTGMNSLGPGEFIMEEERMGRGERSKKKRRFRSLSPLGRSGTPRGRATPDIGGYGGGNALTDQERPLWRCTHCRIRGTAVWAVRDGPYGPKTLCNNCGMLYERDQILPASMRNLHGDPRA